MVEIIKLCLHFTQQIVVVVFFKVLHDFQSNSYKNLNIFHILTDYTYLFEVKEKNKSII